VLECTGFQNFVARHLNAAASEVTLSNQGSSVVGLRKSGAKGPSPVKAENFTPYFVY